MRLFRYLILIVGLFAATASFGASREELNAFKNATKVFADHIFYLAERDFAGFVEKFPASERRSEAILFIAKARYYQTNYAGTIEILNRELSRANGFVDQYHFWIGESYFASGNFEAAAKSYRQLLGGIQKSTLRLEAAYNEALSFSKLKNWTRVIDLLGKPDGEFQDATKARGESEFALNGNLLLAEALAAKDQFAEADKVLAALKTRQLSPLDKWRREFLATKILMAQSRLDGAIHGSTNLLQLAATVSDRNTVAESTALQAEIFERLNRLPEAIESYQKNLAEGIPVEMRRRAVFKSVELTLRQGKKADATKRLQTFIEENSGDPAVDVALLSLGELQLKQAFDLSEPSTNGSAVATTQTNLIQQAYTNFTFIATNFPQSEFFGKALLDLGWCLWTQGQTDEAEKSFADAAKVLPLSEDKAIAIFKRADCQFKRQDYTNAAANYDIVVENFGQLERVKDVLVDQALYQIVRAGIILSNREMAEGAAQKILNLYPNSFFADRSLLLLGQGLNKQGKPSEARKVFSDLIKHFPESSLRPQAELAIARTFVQDRQWTKAIAQFEAWEKAHPKDSMIADAQVSRALAYAQTGEETNALALLTNVVMRFSSNSLAARAESWIGDYYFNAEEFPKAEAHYQEVLKHNPSPELYYQAFLMAGRAAYERQGYDEARKNYFEPLINDTNTPPDVLAETFFALGDTIYKQFLQSTNKSEDLLGYAFSALNHAVNISTNSPLAARAWGRIGDFHLQWGMMQTNDVEFVAAEEAYARVVGLSTADIACRNQAEVGLGKILERRGELIPALVRYRKVLDAEDSDPFWVKEAGLSAARILEAREEWDSASKVYERIGRILPALSPVLEKKIASARAHLESARK